MKLPKLRSTALSRQTVDAFGGYNHNLRIRDGEFYEMQNMTSDFFPVLSPRGRRGLLEQMGKPVNGICFNNGLCHIAGSQVMLSKDDHTYRAVDIGLTDSAKTLLTMGAYLIILPDRKWINIAKCTQWEGQWPDFPAQEDLYGDIDAVWETAFSMAPCRPDGSERVIGDIPTEKPSEPEYGQLWRDCSVYPPVIKVWSEDQGTWVVETAFYTKFTAAGIDHCFDSGDGLQIIGTDPSVLELPANPYVISKGENYIVVSGLVINKTDSSAFGPVQIKRCMPTMDHMVPCGNRLWGCRYGTTDDGFVNEIYASALGDFKNWQRFRNVSTDSYAVSVGVDGPFTGAISYQGRPIFFKENCMIEVLGNYPANFQVQITPCDGVQEGCQNSLVIVNNILYYKSRRGVCAFDGSLPVQIGQVFGEKHYGNAVAGGCAGKYYISMQEETEKNWSLFVFDTDKGLWHKEDALEAVQFCAYQNELYCIPKGRDQVLTMHGSGQQNSAPVEWMVQTGDIGLSLAEAKYISRLTVRLQLDIGSCASFYARYDHTPGWEHLFTLNGTDLHSFTVPIRPKQCDHMQLKIQGTGDGKIYSVTKVIEKGSDLQ